MLEDLQIRNYAPTTVAAYVRSVADPRSDSVALLKRGQSAIIAARRREASTIATPAGFRSDKFEFTSVFFTAKRSENTCFPNAKLLQAKGLCLRHYLFRF
jgi:hypothetical protein